MSVEFDRISVESADGLVSVELSWEGEGLSGDYDENNPKDIPLLRYSVYRKYSELDNEERVANVCDWGEVNDGDWLFVTNSSYCTQLPATAPREQLRIAAYMLLNKVHGPVKNLEYHRKLYESLSWIRLSNKSDGTPTFDDVPVLKRDAHCPMCAAGVPLQKAYMLPQLDSNGLLTGGTIVVSEQVYRTIKRAIEKCQE